MQAIINVFSYISSMGATVMMPIILTILGVVLGAKFGKAFRGGLMVGVGFTGLNLVVGMLGNSLAPAVQQMAERFGLGLSTVDVGWPAASAIAFGTSIGLIIIPLGLLVNVIMLITNTTQTIDVDIWNYWHFAFTGSLVASMTGNVAYGVIASVLNIAIVLVIADFTAPKVEKTLGLPGVSIPHGFTAAFVPIVVVVDKVFDMIPGVKDINVNIEKLQKKFGLFGEPILVGTILGIVIGALAGYDLRTILSTGITLGAALVLIPKMASFLMEGLMPISESAQKFISKKFQNRGKIYIGLDSAVGVGHPICLTVSLILVPIAVFLAVILPGNTVLPMTDLSVLPYMFVLIVPLVNGNGFRALVAGIICLTGGLYISTNIAGIFTSVAESVGFSIPAGANTISSICDGANPLSWILLRANNLGMIGLIAAGIFTVGLAIVNRKRIMKEAQENNSQK